MAQNPYSTIIDSAGAPTVANLAAPVVESPRKRRRLRKLIPFSVLAGAIVGGWLAWSSAESSELAGVAARGTALQICSYAMIGGCAAWVIQFMLGSYRRLLVATAVGGWLAAACGYFVGNVDESRHVGSGRVRAEDFAVSIVPPRSWRLDENRSGGLEFYGPSDHGHHARLKVKADWHLGPAFISDFEREMRSRLPSDALILDEGLTQLDGKKAFFAKISYVNGGKQLVSARYFTLGQGKLYSVAMTSTRRTFARHYRAFAPTLASIRIE